MVAASGEGGGAACWLVLPRPGTSSSMFALLGCSSCWRAPGGGAGELCLCVLSASLSRRRGLEPLGKPLGKSAARQEAAPPRGTSPFSYLAKFFLLAPPRHRSRRQTQGLTGSVLVAP